MMTEPLHITDDRLIDLVNHLLSEAEERTALSHIEQCATCEERLRLALADRETAKSTPAPSLRPDGKGVVPLPRRRPRRLGAIVVVTAAAAVMIAAGAYLVRHRGGPEQYWIPIALDASSLRSADSIAAGSSAAPSGTRGAVEKLEAVANSHKGVEKTYAMQAGREIRVMVKPDQISDADSVVLARDIAKQIEEELEYPGQIKVMVIRESRAVDYAK